MLHYVGHAEDGAVYRDGETDEEHLLPEFVGQIVRVGAAMSAPSVQTVRTPANAAPAGGTRAALAPSPSSLLQREQLTTAMAPAGIDLPAAPSAQQPWWANEGIAEGGYYAETPHAGDPNFAGDSFTALAPGEECWTQEPDPYADPNADPNGWSAPTPAPAPRRPSRGRGRGARGGSSAPGSDAMTSVLEGAGIVRGAYRVAGDVVWPWEVCQKAQEQQQASTLHHQQLLARKKAAKNASSAASSPSKGRGASRQQVSLDDPRIVQQCPGPQCPPQYDPSQYAQPYDPSQYAQPQYEGQPMTDSAQYQDGGEACCEGGYDGSCEGDSCGPSYASGDFVGAAPQGLGSAIGGIAGGIGGMFFGSPEIGAPIGAAIGGGIQGAICHGQGGSPSGAQGHAASASRAYMISGKMTSLPGDYAPDGLFEPAPAPPPSLAPMANLVEMANSLLRQYKPGAAWMAHGRRGGVDPRANGPAAVKGSQAQVRGPQDAQVRGPQDAQVRGPQDAQVRGPQDAQVRGYFDPPRYAVAGIADWPTQAFCWTQDEVNDMANYAYDCVGGGPVAKDFGPYSQATIQTILQALQRGGADVSGGNPYSIDANSNGVKLLATVHPDGTVTVAIAASNFYVSHDAVWSKIDGLMPQADA